MKPVIKVLKISGRDWSNYFIALETMKNGSWKGLSVVHWWDKRKPTKAKQIFVRSADVNESGWKEISASELPANIQARFAEVA